MQTKTKIIISVVAIAVSFATGRYTVPLSTKSETKTSDTKVVDTNKVVNTDSSDHKKTVTQEVDKPDGTRTVTTVVTDDRSKDTKIDDKSTSVDTKLSDTTKEVTRSGSRINISALAGSKITFSSIPKPDYGAMVSKDVIGPINVGIFGFSSGFCGLSVGLSF